MVVDGFFVKTFGHHHPPQLKVRLAFGTCPHGFEVLFLRGALAIFGIHPFMMFF